MPIADIGIGIDMAKGTRIDKARIPMTGQTPDMGGLRIMIIVAADDDHRRLARETSMLGKTSDAAELGYAAKVGRRDQQGTADFRAVNQRRVLEPMGEGMAAQTMGGDQHGLVQRGQNRIKSDHPLVAVRRAPLAQFCAMAVGEFLFPQALPMGGAAIVQSRDGQNAGGGV